MDNLGSKLRETLKNITKSIFIDKKLINELVKDIQRALLSADVNVKLVFDLTERIKKRALEEKEPKGVDKKTHIVNIVYEELVNFLGKEEKGIIIEKKKPFKIMMTGLYGSGKTTSIGKLANYYKKRGHKIAAIGLDVHRPAAPLQLKQLCDSINVDCFINQKEKNPLKILKEYEKEFQNYDILIIDTAGRDALSDDLLKEIKDLYDYIKPDENLLVISADVGQAAQKQAEAFHENARITGVVITKMDGTAKAGGALSACSITNAKIKFIGVGEKIDDLELYDPEGFVSRLLGMGNLKALLEKAKEAITEEDAKDMGEKFIKGDFNLIDLYKQMEAMSKMGPLGKIMEMVPGFGSLEMPKDLLKVQEGKLKKWKFIIDSSTKEELENPDLIGRSRIDRIAKGSGTTSKEVRELLKQYRMGKKVMKTFGGKAGKPKDINKIMKQFKGKLPKGLGI
ncbi:signal recognition particle protein Srp54 [Candidatus Woesearchaeota archaeon]|nr:signal recognition particle protein Srp54 [Candidatus Woesearchaeota archaeon]